MERNMWQNIKDLFLRPSIGATALIREGTLSQAIGIMILAAIVATFNMMLFPEGDNVPAFGLVIFFLIVAYLGLSLFDSLICFILAKALGGQGKFRTLFTLSGYVMCLDIVRSLLDVLLTAAGMPKIIGDIFGVVFVVWMAVVGIIALREVMHLSTFKAAIITFIPFVVFAFAFFLLLVVYVAGGGQLPTN